MLALLAALVSAAFAAAWYASGRIMAVTHVHDDYPLCVGAVDPGVIVLGRGPDAAEPGTFRLAWPTGRARVGAVLRSDRAAVTQRLFAVHGHLAAGQKVGIERNPYTGDPLSALRLSYRTVRVPTELGAAPAWYVRGRRSTWAILIHGLGGSRADTLPAMPVLHALGYPLLAISYRNDEGAPQSPERRSRLGATEWHDANAAVTYAVQHGAGGVVLYGYSLGGAMALIEARSRPAVRAVVLDSPLLDWPATIEYAAHRRGIPHLLADLTVMILAWRVDVDYTQLDQLAHARELHTPVLLFQGGEDTIVPPTLAARFARERPDLVTYVPVAGADHASAIDCDPVAYRRALEHFLTAWP